MPNTVYKNHLLTIDITARTRQVITTNTTFWTRDKETGMLNINFVSKNQPVNLIDATVLLGFYFNDGGSKIVDSKEGSVVIEDAQQGRCHVIMPSYKFDYSGAVLIHVYILYKNGKELDCATVATEFEKSWLDQELPQMEEYYVKRIEDWLAEIEVKTNTIKEELQVRLDDLRQEIIITQEHVQHIQEQIHANDIVTQEEFNNLPIRQRIRVRDWNVFNPLELGLHHGEVVLVYGHSDATNQPFASGSSWAGSVMLVNTLGERFFLELFRSAPSVNDTSAYACRYFENGAWESTWHRRLLPSQTTPLPNANTAQIGTANRVARADHVHPPDPTRLPLTGGWLSGHLNMNVNRNIILNNTVDGLDANMRLSWQDNAIPRIRIGGNNNAGAAAPFQIQGAGDFVRCSIGHTHAEVPGTFRAGGNITAPSFIGSLTGNANTATRMQQVSWGTSGATANQYRKLAEVNFNGIWQDSVVTMMLHCSESGHTQIMLTWHVRLGREITTININRLQAIAIGRNRLNLSNTFTSNVTHLSDDRATFELWCNEAPTYLALRGIILASNRADFNLTTNTTWQVNAPAYISRVHGVDVLQNSSVLEATRLQTARNLQITGDVEGAVSSNLSGDITIPTRKRRLQITNWNDIDPRVLGLRRGDAIAVWGIGDAINQPTGTTGSAWVGTLTCVNDTSSSRFIIEVYTDHRLGARAEFRGGVWSSWDRIPVTGSTRVFDMSVARANQLATARTITLSGAVTGSATFDGTSNITLTAQTSSFKIADWTNLEDLVVKTPKASSTEIYSDSTADPFGGIQYQGVFHKYDEKRGLLERWRLGSNSATPGTKMVRMFTNGTWGNWYLSGTSLIHIDDGRDILQVVEELPNGIHQLYILSGTNGLPFQSNFQGTVNKISDANSSIQMESIENTEYPGLFLQSRVNGAWMGWRYAQASKWQG